MSGYRTLERILEDPAASGGRRTFVDGALVDVASHFSRWPGGRFEEDGPSSGERLREALLLPALSAGPALVRLDGVRGCGSSFLEEAFGGLVRRGLTAEQLRERLKIEAGEDLVEEAWRYVEEAEEAARPSVSAAVVVVVVASTRASSAPRAVLAVSRRGRPDDLGLPGGKVEPGERPEEAAARELLEETGVAAEPGALRLVRVARVGRRLCRGFAAGSWAGDPRPAEPGVEVAWAPPRRLAESGTFRGYNAPLLKKLGLLGEDS